MISDVNLEEHTHTGAGDEQLLTMAHVIPTNPIAIWHLYAFGQWFTTVWPLSCLESLHQSNRCLSLYAQVKSWSDKAQSSTVQKPCSKANEEWLQRLMWQQKGELQGGVRLQNTELCQGFFYSFKELHPKSGQRKASPEVQTVPDFMVCNESWVAGAEAEQSFKGDPTAVSQCLDFQELIQWIWIPF